MDQIHGKAYESMTARRDVNYKNLEQAFPIIEDFIIKNNLVLYGGMAMDLAFQLKGSFIYDPKDNVIPDMDFYSPDPIGHAYQLADILHKEGFPEVNAINALHITTMRVRLGGDTVADISYVPPDIFKKLPLLEFQKGKKRFKIINPMFQRIDLHESLTEPFRDPPHEVIFNRFKKDMKRFKLLEETYPIQLKSKFDPVIKSTILPNVEVLFVGYPSYALHYFQLKEMIKILFKDKLSDAENSKFKEIFPLDIQEKQNLFIVQIPENEPISMYTDDYQDVVHKLCLTDSKLQPKYFNTYLDRSRPRTVRLSEKYEIFDNRRSIKTYVPVKVGKSEIKAASAHLTAMYFLQRYFEHQNDMYLHFYENTLRIIRLTELLLSQKSEKIQNLYMEKMSMFVCSHWFGNYNFGDAFSVQMQYLIANNQGISIPNLRARSYRPADQNKHPEYDIKSMAPYQIDGKEVEPFEPVGSDWISIIEIK
jgi:hypothetical protein